jgi:hypothetical protein
LFGEEQIYLGHYEERNSTSRARRAERRGGDC